MAAIEETPTFNLKAVIQETGLKPDTLRAWERRYGLPRPHRTSGGHRLYSQRDIDMLKWLVARQDEGLSISRAVALWQQLEAEGQDPLQEPGYALPESAPVLTYIPEGETIAELRDEWLAASLNFDEQQARQVLTYALALYPAELVCFEILLKSLQEVGEGWYSGEISVQQEHFVSEVTIRQLETLVRATPAPTRSGRVLAGCAPEEQHAFAPLLLTFLLKQRGWDVVYLGARVPVERLEATVASVEPQLVILTAQQLTTASGLLEAAQLLKQARVPLAFGGRIFTLVPAVIQHIPGHYLGHRLDAAPKLVEQLLSGSPSPSPVRAVTDAYQHALAEYQERRILIEADIWRVMDVTEIEPVHLTIANDTLARNLIAALKLGDMALLHSDIEWIEGLLEKRAINGQKLSHYLKAYQRAAQANLSDASHPILDWLARVNERR